MNMHLLDRGESPKPRTGGPLRSHHVALVLLFVAVYAWTRVAGFLRWVGVLA